MLLYYFFVQQKKKKILLSCERYVTFVLFKKKYIKLPKMSNL